MRTKLGYSFSCLLLAFTVLASVNTEAAQGQQALLTDCDIKVKGVINGTSVNVVITVYDVSWTECFALKAAALLAMPKK